MQPKQKINLLAFAAHPDDVEISASGIMLAHAELGWKTGIIDLTKGELGTRGSAELRKTESAKASEILKLSTRENLDLGDGVFEIDETGLKAVVKRIRRYNPDIILINAESDRHPDHGRAHQLVKRAAFLSGLVKFVTLEDDGSEQAAWRPGTILSYIQDHHLEPHLLIDVSEHWENRMKSLLAYSSQFYNPDSDEPETPISSSEFLKQIEGRAVQFGRLINKKYAEGLRTVNSPLGLDNLSSLLL